MRVSIVRSYDSHEGVVQALKLIQEDILSSFGDGRKFLIKPNFVSVFNELAVTSKACVEGILEFLYGHFDVSEILIGEAPALGSFEDAIRNFGYLELKKKYREVELVDLDDYGHEEIVLEDRRGKFTIPVSKLMLSEDFIRISPCRPKTHDTVIVTLTIKNVVVGSIRKGYKSRIHRGWLEINQDIAMLATKLMPHLGVIDGITGMEEDGPVSGTPKKWGVIFASTNPVSLDAAASYAMGFDPRDIGYLYFLNRWGYGEIDPKKIEILGERLESIKTSFKPHRTYRQQLSWKKSLRE
ncbi:MAG: DUF362 domain-containing protein [Thaumarchaeota archaeon]|nr:DUF362 domain-containing protein [Nitrososphaerota archaeon]